MTATSANSSSINNSARCNYHFRNGMRCRLLCFGNQPFCPKHAQPAAPPSEPAYSPDVAAALTAGLDDFTSAEQVNTFLARVLLFTAQDKITPRRATVLTYIASQLLRSISTLIQEEKADKDKPIDVIFDAPRPNWNSPDRSGDSSPQAASADTSTPDTTHHLAPLAKVPA